MANLNYEVGDTFEGSPIELNRWVSPIWAIGGRVEFDGSTATIVYLPIPKSPEPEDYFKSFTKQLEPKTEEVVEVPEKVEALEKVELEEVAEVTEKVAEVTEKVKEVVEKIEEAPKVKVAVRPPGRPKKAADPVDEVK